MPKKTGRRQSHPPERQERAYCAEGAAGNPTKCRGRVLDASTPSRDPPGVIHIIAHTLNSASNRITSQTWSQIVTIARFRVRKNGFFVQIIS